MPEVDEVAVEPYAAEQDLELCGHLFAPRAATSDGVAA